MTILLFALLGAGLHVTWRKWRRGPAAGAPDASNKKNWHTFCSITCVAPRIRLFLLAEV